MRNHRHVLTDLEEAAVRKADVFEQWMQTAPMRKGARMVASMKKNGKIAAIAKIALLACLMTVCSEAPSLAQNANAGP